MADEQDKKKDRLFSDISVIQVTATALAAVTSMLLASYIGIAGSVIGTAVASVVSTVAASAYKKFMRDSAEKIKELPLPTIPTISDGLAKSRGTSDVANEKGEAGTTTAAEETADSSEPAEEASTSESGIEDAAKANTVESTAESESTDSADTADSAELASESERSAAIAHQKKVQRGLIAVCVISALLAVAASGAVVYLLTTGEGLGVKPTVIYAGKSEDPSSQTVHSNGDIKQSADEATQPESGDSASSADASSSIRLSASSASPSSAPTGSSASSASSSSTSSTSSSSGSSAASSEPPETNSGDDNAGSSGNDSGPEEATDDDSAPLAPIAQRLAAPAGS